MLLIRIDGGSVDWIAVWIDLQAECPAVNHRLLEMKNGCTATKKIGPG
jgi:hypothetical protein